MTNQNTVPVSEPGPDQPQVVDTFTYTVMQELKDIKTAIDANSKTIQTLSETLALHVKQNIDTFQSIQSYIGEQMNYRLFRQGIEENNLALELAKRNLELDFLQKKYRSLEEEHSEDEQIRYEAERQRLEIENLQKNIDLLRNAKQSTQDKIKPVKPTGGLGFEIKKVIILTAIGTTVAAATGGVIAFVLWLIRLYLTTGKL